MRTERSQPGLTPSITKQKLKQKLYGQQEHEIEQIA
jgi:hypothetical protein